MLLLLAPIAGTGTVVIFQRTATTNITAPTAFPYATVVLFTTLAGLLLLSSASENRVTAAALTATLVTVTVTRPIC